MATWCRDSQIVVMPHLALRLATRFVLPLVLAAASGPAAADPGYYVVTAYDNEGQRTIDLRYWTVKKPGKAAMLWPEVGFGYGVTSRWHTELLASFIGTADTATRLDDWQWQNNLVPRRTRDEGFDTSARTGFVNPFALSLSKGSSHGEPGTRASIPQPERGS